MLLSSIKQNNPLSLSSTNQNNSSNRQASMQKHSQKTNTSLKEFNAITTRSSIQKDGVYSFSKHENSQNSNRNMKNNINSTKKQQIDVSEFIVQDQHQQQNQQQQTIQSNLNDKDTDMLLTNISQIIHCKKQAQSLLSQIQLYIKTIHKLRNQSKKSNLSLLQKQQQCQQLRNLLHIRDIQILSLKQQKQKMMRNNCVNIAKINILRNLERENIEKQWQNVMGAGLKQEGDDLWREEKQREILWEIMDDRNRNINNNNDIDMDQYSIAMSMSMNGQTNMKQSINDSKQNVMKSQIQQHNKAIIHKNRNTQQQIPNSSYIYQHFNQNSGSSVKNSNINIGKLLKQTSTYHQKTNNSLANMYGRIIKSGNNKNNNKQYKRQQLSHQFYQQHQHKWNQQSTFL